MKIVTRIEEIRDRLRRMTEELYSILDELEEYKKIRRLDDISNAISSISEAKDSLIDAACHLENLLDTYKLLTSEVRMAEG